MKHAINILDLISGDPDDQFTALEFILNKPEITQLEVGLALMLIRDLRKTFIQPKIAKPTEPIFYERKPHPKRTGALKRFLDVTLKAGGTWTGMAKRMNQFCEKNGYTTKWSPSKLKWNLEKRVNRDRTFLGEAEITENGIFTKAMVE